MEGNIVLQHKPEQVFSLVVLFLFFAQQLNMIFCLYTCNFSFVSRQTDRQIDADIADYSMNMYVCRT